MAHELTYPGTEVLIEEGDWVAAVGLGEGDDYGQVRNVDADTREVDIHWQGSETRVVHPVASLANVEAYTSLMSARAAYFDAQA